MEQYQEELEHIRKRLRESEAKQGDAEEQWIDRPGLRCCRTQPCRKHEEGIENNEDCRRIR